MKRLLFVLLLLLLLTLTTAFAANAAALPADGVYWIDVRLTGGSGRSAIQSPAVMTVKDGTASATLVWNSANYTYMRLDGVQYDAAATQPGSTFVIPVTLDQALAFTAQTVAMSTPREIDYTLTFDSSTIAACSAADSAVQPKQDAQPEANEQSWRTAAADLGNGWQAEHETALVYAEHFAIYTYQDGFQLLAMSDGSRFLIVPEEQAIPESLASDIVVLKKPVGNIYLAATASASLLEAIGSLDSITLTSTQATGWYNDNIRAAVEDGRIGYAGKYNSPDYELILQSGCALAVESLMITHAPEVKEKLEELGIPVLIDLSSQEPHPLGRTEWLKVYAALTGKKSEADRLFQEQEAYLDAAMGETGKTVAFFYINSDGNAVVRKPNDYIARMIELAGGKYVFSAIDQSAAATSTAAMEMEQFYAAAKDADIVVYNSAIGGMLNSLDEFLAKSPLLSDFKAVKYGEVWCTTQNMYQETMQLGKMTAEMHKLFAGDAEDSFSYLYRLQ